jgi:hypothetical protein
MQRKAPVKCNAVWLSSTTFRKKLQPGWSTNFGLRPSAVKRIAFSNAASQETYCAGALAFARWDNRNGMTERKFLRDFIRLQIQSRAG